MMNSESRKRLSEMTTEPPKFSLGGIEGFGTKSDHPATPENMCPRCGKYRPHGCLCHIPIGGRDDARNELAAPVPAAPAAIARGES